MLTLPPVAPATGWRSSTRLARDHYVRLDGNDYSVHPTVIGRRVEVLADLHRVRVLCDGRGVADHERIWAKHQTVSADEHVTARGDALDRRHPVGIAQRHLEHRQATGDEAVGDRVGGRLVGHRGERHDAAEREAHRPIQPPSTGSVTPVT